MGPHGAPWAPMGPHGPPWAPRGPRRDARAARGVPEPPEGCQSPAPVVGLQASSQGRFFSPKNAFLEKHVNFEVEKKVEIWPIWTHHDLRRPCPVILLNFTKVKKS